MDFRKLLCWLLITAFELGFWAVVGWYVGNYLGLILEGH